MQVEEERHLARERVALFKSRYKGADESFFPIQVAMSWAEALEEEPPKGNRLKEIAEIAMQRRDKFDVAFFTFCNHIEMVCRDL